MTNNLLFYDTETTGLAKMQASSRQKDQPDITQLTALLTDWDGNKLCSMDAMIYPNGWEITNHKVIELTGLTTERCMQGGIHIESAWHLFMNMVHQAGVMIGHNEAFDRKMLRITSWRIPTYDGMEEDRTLIKAMPGFCTMHKSRAVCKEAPTDKMMAAGYKTNKNPKLEYAYLFFAGKDFVHGHNAMYDVLATKTIFMGLREREIGPEAFFDHDRFNVERVARAEPLDDRQAGFTSDELPFNDDMGRLEDDDDGPSPI